MAHDRFQASWYLSPEELEEGQRMASGDPDRSHLVLRAFCLGAGAPEGGLSSRWHDFAVEGVVASRYFGLPYGSERLRAVLGLRNASGRFSPLLRSEVISLPAAPVSAEASGPPPEPAPVSTGPGRLPEELRTIPMTPKGDKLFALDETAVLEAVDRAFVVDPQPDIPSQPAAAAVHAGASGQLASQWEDLWSPGAPVEVKAELVIAGRLGGGLRLLLGHEEVTLAPGGFFHWKRTLDDFNQAWPLLQAGLSVPTVPAEPALRFFREAGGIPPLLELQASLEIAGRVTDPAYRGRLPEGLRPDESGVFKLTRSLPHGAVILPGLSLIAS